MEKCEKIEAQIPEAIIQHIQSFLTGKKAAQTTILSKSWYIAWLTRPNLEFVESDFRTNSYEYLQSESAFAKFAKKTVHRYEELNLKIASLRLWMYGSWMNCNELYKSSLANECIAKAMKMGATGLNFALAMQRDNFILPHEVLESETLERLYVIGCKIELGLDRRVSCSKLKTLSFHRVCTQGNIIWDIISICPLIEKLVLSECKYLINVDVYKTGTRMLILNPRPGVNVPPYEFHKLKLLLLEKVDIGTWLFRDFSSRFPCLKKLALHHCVGYREIQIYSDSLEWISFAQARMLRAKFDFPRIQKFKFSGSCIPSMSLRTTSREWESDICMTCKRNSYSLQTSWFLKFKEFLMEFSPSKISLSLNIRISSEKSSDYAGDIRVSPKPPIVEDLKLLMDAPSAVCSALLKGLFWSCRPKFITPYWLPKSFIEEKTNYDFIKILCKTLIKEVSENCFIPNRDMSGLHDLEEVLVENFEENIAEWRPLPWQILLDASAYSGNKKKVRFQLRWGHGLAKRSSNEVTAHD